MPSPLDDLATKHRATLQQLNSSATPPTAEALRGFLEDARAWRPDPRDIRALTDAPAVKRVAVVFAFAVGGSGPDLGSTLEAIAESLEGDVELEHEFSEHAPPPSEPPSAPPHGPEAARNARDRAEARAVHNRLADEALASAPRVEAEELAEAHPDLAQALGDESRARGAEDEPTPETVPSQPEPGTEPEPPPSPARPE